MTIAKARRDEPKTVVVVGGGFAGSLFALKMAQARSDFRVVLVERQARRGRGLAYGACAPHHLLNVPVSRMELGLTPGFAQWLEAKHFAALQDALAESGGDLASAYVSRELFGDYLQQRIDGAAGIVLLRGEAVRALDPPSRGVMLEDGREIKADLVVLATGNQPPRPPHVEDGSFYDTPNFVPDPWARGAFDGLDPEVDVALLGTGQTMVDIALTLSARGHRGTLHAVSRHGLLPHVHKAGGKWEPFVKPAPPRALMTIIRAQVKQAMAQGVPWQRVIDAVRPNIGQVWHAWSESERTLFLRHLRARWDVHRSRMAPRIARDVQALIARGQLTVSAGRIRAYRARPGGVEIELARHGATRRLSVSSVVNCTGPRGDLGRTAIPLIADLRRRGAIVPDPLGLGIETDDCAARDSHGRASAWLFALGPLTRPAWWEITAVPEIAVQIDRLVRQLAQPQQPQATAPLAEAFVDLGAGI